MKSLIKRCIGITSLSCVSVAMAGPASINLYMGAAFSRLSSRSTVAPVTGLSKTYTPNQGTQTAPFAGLGVEYAFNHLGAKPFTLSLGLSAYYINLGKVSGTEIPGSNIGLTDPLNYSMKAKSIAALFEPRLIYTACTLQPYLLTGAGYASNTLNSFQESTPAGSHALPGNPYSDHTQGSFAYEFGAGIQYPLTKKNAHLLFRFEYRYLNLGDAELGTASDQTTNDRLEVKNTSANIVDIGLSYLF